MEDISNMEAIWLGFIQGTTEFLPISSSAHLIVTSWFMNGKPITMPMNIALHFGSLLAVLIFFIKDWIRLLQKSFCFLFKKEKSFESHVLLPGLIVGTIPAGILGVCMGDLINQYLHHPIVTILPLAIFGFVFWWVDKKRPQSKNIEQMDLKSFVVIGFAQALALIPGMSRSGATITAGRWLHMEREQAAKFSFLLGTPAILGATLLNLKDISSEITANPALIMGLLSSLLVGLASIKFLLEIFKRFGLLWCAIYRVALAIFIGLALLRVFE